jgi:pimeloyl-ACP methyl ester carboxylesterase
MRIIRAFLVLIGVIILSAASGIAPAAEKKPASGTFDSNGIKTWYSVQGQGEPVVLIHGWLSSAGINWDLPGTTALLAKDFQVIELDMRGHGQSDKPVKEEEYGSELVEDVVRLMDYLKVNKAHIVGYSMGGIVAGNFIVKHPDRALSGTLGGMGWLKSGGVGQWAFGQIGKNDPNARAAAVCGRSLAKLALTEDEIKAIKVPMVVLIGDKDRLVYKLYVEPLKPVRPDWQVVEIKDADHLSCILKSQFKEEIQKWLVKQTKQR